MSNMIPIFEDDFFPRIREVGASSLSANIVKLRKHIQKIGGILEDRFAIETPPISFRLIGNFGSYFNKTSCELNGAPWFGIVLPVTFSLPATTWIMLHEYQHYYQHEIGRYYTRHLDCTWHGRPVEVSPFECDEAKYIRLPWEAEADAFANSNHVAVCSNISIDLAIPDKISMVPGRISPVIPGKFVHPSTFSLMKGG